MSALDLADPATIADLVEVMRSAGVHGLEVCAGSDRLRIALAQDGLRAGPSSGLEPGAPAATAVKAPLAGNFHLLSDADGSGEDLPRPVSATDVVAFIRIGPVMLPVAAGHAGILARRLAEPGALVGFDDPLFVLEPAA